MLRRVCGRRTDAIFGVGAGNGTRSDLGRCGSLRHGRKRKEGAKNAGLKGYPDAFELKCFDHNFKKSEMFGCESMYD